MRGTPPVTVKLRNLALATYVSVLYFALSAPFAFAEVKDAKQIGHNIGNTFESLGKDGFKVTALIAIFLLFARKIAAFVVFLGAAAICGLFVYAGDTAGLLIQAIWNSVAGTK
jgi:hypothetical protein